MTTGRRLRGGSGAASSSMDEVGTQSWEEAVGSVEMEKRLEDKLRISQKEKTTMVIQDESLQAATPPQIRILKRPANNGSLGSPLSQTRPTPQVKSLAQREAEYAEARKRILGSACPQETPQEKPSADKSGRSNSTLPSETSRSQHPSVDQQDSTQRFRQHR